MFRLTAIVLFILHAAAGAATYYVSPSGSDSNAGSQAAPFRTVAKGVNTANPGDTVILEDGTYGNEGHISDGTGCYYGCAAPVWITNAGTSSAWITLKAENKWGAVLDCGTTTTQLGCDTYLDFADTAAYWVIQDLVIMRGAFAGIHDNTAASHLTFTGNQIEYIGNYYTTTQIGICGIGFGNSSTNITIEGNVIHDVGRTGGLSILNHDHGIYASGANATITNNIFYNNSKGWDIQTSHGANNWLIANNTFAFSSLAGSGQIILWDGEVANSISNITIRNNIFYNPSGPAIVTYSDVGTSSIPGCSIDHNLTTASSIYDNGMSCATSSNMLSTNPALMNVSASPYDFHLQSGSPAIDQGMTVSAVPKDFDGNLRPQGAAYDIGAYEFVSSTGSNGGSGSGTGSGSNTGSGTGGGTSGSGPVAYWGFNELSGSTTADLSGDGNTGTLHHATWSTSGCSACLQFNGSSAYVSVNESSSLELTNQLTIAVWVNPASKSGSDPRIVSKLYDWELKLNGSSPQFSAAGKYAVMNYSAAVNKWQHLVFTFSNGVVNAYVNGAPVTLGANTFAGAAASFSMYQYGLYIGTDPSLAYWFKGYLDEVRIYNRPLSAAEVSALYQSTLH